MATGGRLALRRLSSAACSLGPITPGAAVVPAPAGALTSTRDKQPMPRVGRGEVAPQRQRGEPQQDHKHPAHRSSINPVDLIHGSASASSRDSQPISSGSYAPSSAL
jgi:hypothetical protein